MGVPLEKRQRLKRGASVPWRSLDRSPDYKALAGGSGQCRRKEKKKRIGEMNRPGMKRLAAYLLTGTPGQKAVRSREKGEVVELMRQRTTLRRTEEEREKKRVLPSEKVAVAYLGVPRAPRG